MLRQVLVMAISGLMAPQLAWSQPLDIERPVTEEELEAINFGPVLTVEAECQHGGVGPSGEFLWDLTVYLSNEGSLNVPAGRFHLKWWDWDLDDYGQPIEQVYPPLPAGFLKHVFRYQIKKRSGQEDFRAFQVQTSNRTLQGLCPCLRNGVFVCGDKLDPGFGTGCGIGPELVLLLPGLMLMRDRRRRQLG